MVRRPYPRPPARKVTSDTLADLRSPAPRGTISRMTTPTPPVTPTDYDVLIVGAGISGIGAAYYLTSRSPGRSFAILEGREAIGGTWDLFLLPRFRLHYELVTFGS